MTYRVGELDQRVTFQESISTPDGMGGYTSVWQNIANFPVAWAHIRPKSGREVTEYNRVNAEVGYLLVVRYREDISPSYRLLWEGISFNIKVIKQPSGRKLYLEMDIEKGVPT